MKSKNWIIGWGVVVSIFLSIICILVIKIDPYFHYHKPDLNKYYYSLDNQRSQNNGVIKNFDYDALITGSSMTENFKTSEMDHIFSVKSIKVPFSGGTYKEINDNLVFALENNLKFKTIVRSLDYSKIFDDKDLMRTDLGEYPTYLYDSNPVNDVRYLFNKDVVFGRIYPMISNKSETNFKPGITSFDDYASWQKNYTFGKNSVIPNGIKSIEKSKPVHLTNEEKQTINENIAQNVTSLAAKYPDVNFYYFFPPYSAVFWNDLNNDGTIYKQIEAESYAIELILKYPNIHLYSFNMLTDITTDLNNYKDSTHYGQWINSLMLRYMKNNKCLLTKENYRSYLDEELKFYTSFDYSSLNDQIDYEDDLYKADIVDKNY